MGLEPGLYVVEPALGPGRPARAGAAADLAWAQRVARRMGEGMDRDREGGRTRHRARGITLFQRGTGCRTIP